MQYSNQARNNVLGSRSPPFYSKRIQLPFSSLYDLLGITLKVMRSGHFLCHFSFSKSVKQYFKQYPFKGLFVCPFYGLDPCNRKFLVARMSNTIIMRCIMARVHTRISSIYFSLKVIRTGQ